MQKHLKLIGDLARAWGVGLALVRPWKLIVSLVLVSGVALAGAISVEAGGYQYLTGLVLTAPSGTASVKMVLGSRICTDLACTRFIYENSPNIETSSGILVNGAVVSANSSGANAFEVSTIGARIAYGGGPYSSSDGTTVTFSGPIKSASTLTRGNIALVAGTGTAAVLSGAICTCTDTTAVAAVQCAVVTTTLTATGTGTDTIAYICL